MLAFLAAGHTLPIRPPAWGGWGAAIDGGGLGAAVGAGGVGVAVGDLTRVVVGGPGVPFAGRVRERAERVPEALVARPAEARDFAFPGFDRDWGLAGVAGERVAGGVARAGVADLGEQGRGAHDGVGVAEQREEDPAVGMFAHGG